jgi:hypothetical protein
VHLSLTQPSTFPNVKIIGFSFIKRSLNTWPKTSPQNSLSLSLTSPSKLSHVQLQLVAMSLRINDD